MNSVLLSKNKYTAIGFGQTDKHSEKQYRLFINRVKLKQKNYTNVLVMFVNLYNTFITEKYSDEKDLWLIVNNNQTTNYDLLDSKGKIYDYTSIIKELENRIMNLENNLRPVTGATLGQSFIYLKGSCGYSTHGDGACSSWSLNWNLYNIQKQNNSLIYIKDKMLTYKYTFTTRVTKTINWKGITRNSPAQYRSTTIEVNLSI